MLKNIIEYREKTALKADMSGRKYSRLVEKDGNTSILMESLADSHPDSIAGHKIGDYVRIAEALRSAGLCVPVIYDYSAVEGYMLLEDFGDESFSGKISKGEDVEVLYSLAIDVLIEMRNSPELSDLELKSYYDGHVHENKKFVMEFYLAEMKGEAVSAKLVDEYKSIWKNIEDSQPKCPVTFQHIDFFPGNLMYRKGEEGIDQCGIIDFQGAQLAPYIYDIVNLLEDARSTVPDDIKTRMKDRFCLGMTDDEKEMFNIWYAILSAQFHLRVIGQFIRIRDVLGNSEYMQYMPRIAGYLRCELKNPLLKELKDFFDRLDVDFNFVPK